MAFMPEFAPIVVLLFLGTVFALGVTSLVIVYGLVRKKPVVVRYGAIVALAGAACYGAVLLGDSLASHERVLRAGERKYFCEIDCHVAYSIVEVAAKRTLGAPPNEKTAAGYFYLVKVKTWFDPDTISSQRGNGLLTPNPRRILVVDEQGREYGPSFEGQTALELAHGSSTPLTAPLRPGESYTTEFVFDLPAASRNPRLLITDSTELLRFLIGHENSPFHKKIYFGLSPRAEAADSRP